VAPRIIGMTKHFMFHIRWISILKFFLFFSDSFYITFLSDGIATSISKQILSFMFLIIMSGLFARTSLPVCTPWFHSTVVVVVIIIIIIIIIIIALFLLMFSREKYPSWTLSIRVPTRQIRKYSYFHREQCIKTV
jgi:hypothetical protein